MLATQKNLLLTTFFSYSVLAINVENSFLSRSLLFQISLAVFSGVVISAISFKSDAVHTPFLINLFFSLALGWLQPKKGWILALVLIASVLISYYAIHLLGILTPLDAEIAQFTSLLGLFVTLVGTFMGAFLKRAIS